jgi:hypothetical protein
MREGVHRPQVPSEHWIILMLSANVGLSPFQSQYLDWGRLHDTVSEKTVIFILSDWRTWSLTQTPVEFPICSQQIRMIKAVTQSRESVMQFLSFFSESSSHVRVAAPLLKSVSSNTPVMHTCRCGLGSVMVRYPPINTGAAAATTWTALASKIHKMVPGTALTASC